MADINLTGTQEQVLKYIRSFSDENGYPPTRAEIADCFLWSSANAAECHLRALERKGAITIAPGISRGIKVIV